MSRASRLGVVVAASALLTLTACVSPTPYKPQTAENPDGYSDLQLTANRYRITFSGNEATDRQTVENYLLYHAAEVTLRAGYNWFMFDTRTTRAKTTYMSTFEGWPGWDGYGWYWHNWWGPGWGMGPGWGAGAGYAQSEPITRFKAYAEIVLLTDAQAHKVPRAINAHQLVAHLMPLIQRPKPKPGG